MARQRYSDEECLRILRQVEVELAAGADVATSCRSAGISDATLRREILNAEWFATTRQAQTVINQWLRQPLDLGLSEVLAGPSFLGERPEQNSEDQNKWQRGLLGALAMRSAVF